MYEDFLEQSTRYDDLKIERDTIIREVEENFFGIPELKNYAGTGDISLFDDDESRPGIISRLFRHLKQSYEDYVNNKGSQNSPHQNESNGRRQSETSMSPGKNLKNSKDRSNFKSEMDSFKRDQDKAENQIIDLNDQLAEAKEMIKAMDTSMHDLNNELRKMKQGKTELAADYSRKESELELEISELCEEVTTYRRMAEERGKELQILRNSSKDSFRKYNDHSSIMEHEHVQLKETADSLKMDNEELLNEIMGFKQLLKDTEQRENTKNQHLVSIKKDFLDERKKLLEEIDRLNALLTKKGIISGDDAKSYLSRVLFSL